MENLKTAASAYRNWAEIDLDNLLFNFRQARSLAEGRGLMPVIKADAYGHGAVQAAEVLDQEGADMFAVAAPQEALQLRRHGIRRPILILGGVPAGMVKTLAEQGITLSVGSLRAAETYAGVLQGVRLSVHVKLDTGMGRLGLRTLNGTEDTVSMIEAVAALPGIEVTGLFTHFADADSPKGEPFTASQVKRFEDVCGLYAQRHPAPAVLMHCDNSAAIMGGLRAHKDNMVRPGIMLYGYSPNPDLFSAALRPVMSLRALITQVKTIYEGETVSYGRTWTSPGERRIATVSIGYADGLPRLCSGGIHMLVHGQQVPQIGRICMDMCMLDVTGVPDVNAGDVATVFGADGRNRITAREVADAARTIPYEVLCAVSKRVPRIYLEGNRVVGKACCIDEL